MMHHARNTCQCPSLYFSGTWNVVENVAGSAADYLYSVAKFGILEGELGNVSRDRLSKGKSPPPGSVCYIFGMAVMSV